MQCTQGLAQGPRPGPGQVGMKVHRAHRLYGAPFSGRTTCAPRRTSTGHKPRRLAVVRVGDDQALAQMARLSNKKLLDEAARRFQAGIELGMDEDYLVARELGASDLSSLTDMQVQYKDKIKGKLFQRLAELKAEDEAIKAKLSKNLELGKDAYGCGEYVAAVKLLETSVEELDPNSQLGGEAQLWLALAYQACGREADCIDLYKSIEQNHPLFKVRKQAGDLRYIMEAPKLELGEDERVTIPLINSSDTWRAKERKTGYSPRLTPPAAKKVKSSYWDSATWDVSKPFVPDKWYVPVAWTVVLIGLTVYGWWQTNGQP